MTGDTFKSNVTLKASNKENKSVGDICQAKPTCFDASLVRSSLYRKWAIVSIDLEHPALVKRLANLKKLELSDLAVGPSVVCEVFGTTF